MLKLQSLKIQHVLRSTLSIEKSNKNHLNFDFLILIDRHKTDEQIGLKID